MEGLGALRSFVAKHRGEAPSLDQEAEEIDSRLRSIYEERELARGATNASYAAIPPLFVKGKRSLLQHLLRSSARARFFDRMHDTVITKDDIEQLAEVLGGISSPPDDSTARMNYDAFCIARDSAPERVHRLFSASIFGKFRRDEHGRISVPLFYEFAFQVFNYENDRLAMMLYDSEGAGNLTEEELESYVRDQAVALEGLSGVQDKFMDFYVHTAVRKLVFFVEGSRPGRVSIRDLLVSDAYEEFARLRSPDFDEGHDADNWFTHSNAMRVYRQYLDLDLDHNGMLTARELKNYAMGSLTWTFIQRVFEEHHTYSGEMDYRNFLDFVLAVENMGTTKGLKVLGRGAGAAHARVTPRPRRAPQYMWKVLDVHGDGRLTRWTVNFFFRDIVERMRRQGEEPVNVDDVGDEIFDMVRPAEAEFITLDDLLACGVGETVVRMLVDVKGFLDYDNREAMLHEEDEDEEQQQQKKEEELLAHLSPGDRARVQLGLMPPPVGVRRRDGGGGGDDGARQTGMHFSVGGSREV